MLNKSISSTPGFDRLGVFTYGFVLINKKGVLVMALSFEVFKDRMRGLVRNFEPEIELDCFVDPYDGNYKARCTDGTMIVCRPNALKITVLWGDRHVAMATLS